MATKRSKSTLAETKQAIKQLQTFNILTKKIEKNADELRHLTSETRTVLRNLKEVNFLGPEAECPT